MSTVMMTSVSETAIALTIVYSLEPLPLIVFRARRVTTQRLRT